MASRIQGITVEIGGDTTKLSSALSGVNKEIKNTQSQLKDVEKLLKLDPTNTELLAQKQRLLGDAIKETKDKLDTLKTAASQANEQLQKGDITQEQYDGLQREIQETEQKLKSLEEQAAKTNTTLLKIDEVGGKLKDVGDKVSGVGKALMPVSAGVTALGTAAVKMTSDFDSGMSRVAAISGATDEELSKLRQTAKDLGASTAFSASETAAGMENLASAGFEVNEIIEVMPGMLDLAASSGEDPLQALQQFRGVCHSGGRHRQLRGDPAGWSSLPVQLGDSAGAGVYRRKYRHLYRHGFHDSGVWQIPRGCDPPG